jgi:hypothetical protein
MDKAQKWRSTKNFSRFIRNPLGFAIWRYHYAVKQGTHIPYNLINIVSGISSSLHVYSDQ